MSKNQSVNKKLGRSIARLRFEEKLSQRELGIKLGGIMQQQVYRWEKGINEVPNIMIEKMCNLFDANYVNFEIILCK